MQRQRERERERERMWNNSMDWWKNDRWALIYVSLWHLKYITKYLPYSYSILEYSCESERTMPSHLTAGTYWDWSGSESADLNVNNVLWGTGKHHEVQEKIYHQYSFVPRDTGNWSRFLKMELQYMFWDCNFLMHKGKVVSFCLLVILAEREIRSKKWTCLSFTQ